MKRAVLLHGTDSSTNHHWFPWLKGQFEASGYEVFSPQLSGNHRPDKVVYADSMQASGWDFTDNVLVGHSSGATTVINLLGEEWFPKQRAIVLVSAFLNERLTRMADWVEEGQFDMLFSKTGFDTAAIHKKGGKVYFVHSDDDPYCSFEDAKKMCAELGGVFIPVHDGHHLGGESKLSELPALAEQLRKDGILT